MRPKPPAHASEVRHDSEPAPADRVVQASIDDVLSDASHAGRERAERRRTEEVAARELERRYRDGLKLTETNRALMGEFDFDEVTAILCRAARALLGADGATFVMREGERVRYVQEDAISPLWKGQDFALDACVSGWAIARGETAVIGDVYADPRVPMDAYRPTFVKAMVMAPVGPGLKFASLGVYWARTHQPSEYDLELLSSLTSAADLALAGVRAFQEACQARAEAERANRLKDEFLSTISHELRSPLNGIVGFAELLLRDPAASAHASVRRSAGKILRNAQAQATLINDLLDLSRLQTGTLAIDQKPCELGAIVVDAVDGVREEAAEKHVALALDLTSSPLCLTADPVRIKQVLWHLLQNAIKFTPRGGTVFVRLHGREDQAELEVEDTGQGIAAEFLPKVFERFRQADARLTRAHGGMGVGLALVKELVEAHGGRVSVASGGPGRGALFRVMLPCQPAAPERAEGAALVRGVLGGVRILVVDDTEDSAELLALLLESEGARVCMALSGAQALEAAQAQDFDLIFSDISMPGMDGYELIRTLRTTPRHALTPAVALTGFGRPEDVTQARHAGFHAHVTKPLDINRVVKLVRSTLAL